MTVFNIVKSPILIQFLSAHLLDWHCKSGMTKLVKD